MYVRKRKKPSSGSGDSSVGQNTKSWMNTSSSMSQGRSSLQERDESQHVVASAGSLPSQDRRNYSSSHLDGQTYNLARRDTQYPSQYYDKQTFSQDHKQTNSQYNRQANPQDYRQAQPQENRQANPHDYRQAYPQDYRQANPQDYRQAYPQENRQPYIVDYRHSYTKDSRQPYTQDSRQSYAQGTSREAYRQDSTQTYYSQDNRDFGFGYQYSERENHNRDNRPKHMPKFDTSFVTPSFSENRLHSGNDGNAPFSHQHSRSQHFPNSSLGMNVGTQAVRNDGRDHREHGHFPMDEFRSPSHWVQQQGQSSAFGMNRQGEGQSLAKDFKNVIDKFSFQEERNKTFPSNRSDNHEGSGGERKFMKEDGSSSEKIVALEILNSLLKQQKKVKDSHTGKSKAEHIQKKKSRWDDGKKVNPPRPSVPDKEKEESMSFDNWRKPDQVKEESMSYDNWRKPEKVKEESMSFDNWRRSSLKNSGDSLVPSLMDLPMGGDQMLHGLNHPTPSSSIYRDFKSTQEWNNETMNSDAYPQMVIGEPPLSVIGSFISGCMSKPISGSLQYRLGKQERTPPANNESKKQKTSVFKRLSTSSSPGKSVMSRLGPKTDIALRLGKTPMKNTSQNNKDKKSKLTRMVSQLTLMKVPYKSLLCKACKKTGFKSIRSYVAHMHGVDQNDHRKSHKAMVKSYLEKLEAVSSLAKITAEKGYATTTQNADFKSWQKHLCSICALPSRNHLKSEYSNIYHNLILSRKCCTSKEVLGLADYVTHTEDITHILHENRIEKANTGKLGKSRQSLENLYKAYKNGEETSITEGVKLLKQDLIRCNLALRAEVYEAFGKDNIPKRYIKLVKWCEVKDEPQPQPVASQNTPKTTKSKHYDPSCAYGKNQIEVEAEIHCNACSKVIENSQESILEHCSSREHYDNLIIMKQRRETQNSTQPQDSAETKEEPQQSAETEEEPLEVAETEEEPLGSTEEKIKEREGSSTLDVMSKANCGDDEGFDLPQMYDGNDTHDLIYGHDALVKEEEESKGVCSDADINKKKLKALSNEEAGEPTVKAEGDVSPEADMSKVSDTFDSAVHGDREDYSDGEKSPSEAGDDAINDTFEEKPESGDQSSVESPAIEDIENKEEEELVSTGEGNSQEVDNKDLLGVLSYNEGVEEMDHEGQVICLDDDDDDDSVVEIHDEEEGQGDGIESDDEEIACIDSDDDNEGNEMEWNE